MTHRSALFALLTTLVTSACTNTPTTSGAAGQSVVVQTAPADADVTPGATVKFTAQVTGSADTSVTWSVDEANGGSIDASGLYTAPAIEGTYHVRAEQASASTTGTTTTASQLAVNLAVSSKKGGGTSNVHVGKGGGAQQVAVVVNPGAATLPAGGSATFVATVTGTTNTSVAWSLQEGSSCGSISSAGVYTAPNVASTCHVVATSIADPTRSASAAVSVTAPSSLTVAIAISPATATLDACTGQVFTATVTNASNTAATWKVTEVGGGTVTNGAYAAPQAPGTYHVVATSVADPTRSVQGTITVGPEKVLSVSVAPGSGTVQTNGTLALAAMVTTSCGTFAAQ